MEDTSIHDGGSFGFAKGLSLALVFFTITPLIIFVSAFSLLSFQRTERTEVLGTFVENPIQPGMSVYASLPDEATSIKSGVEGEDARVSLLTQYLRSHYSPLEKHSSYIVRVSDENSLDYRLLVAIAQQESNLCKRIPPNSYNCWGWGIHSKGTLHFDSFEQGIAVVAEGIKENYVDKGYTNVEDIMSKYTPLSQGSWASGVSKFMSDIEELTY